MGLAAAFVVFSRHSTSRVGSRLQWRPPPLNGWQTGTDLVLNVVKGTVISGFCSYHLLTHHENSSHTLY